MHAVAYYVEKARQCRRLSRAVGDDRAVAELVLMAQEYEAKARAAEVAEAPRTPADGDGARRRA